MIGLPKVKYVKDQLCSSCEVSKAKRSSFKTKTIPSSKRRLNLLHIDFCGPMQVASINGKKYILNGVVERRNHTLVEAARTILLASKIPLFFWAEAIATACYSQNRSIIIPTREKTAYHIINDKKPSIKHFHIFGCTCYLTRDGENLDKIKVKGDPYILVGYSTQSNGYRVYNKRTRLIVESIHLKFDEIKEMSETENESSSPIDNCKQRDTPPKTNIQSITEPTIPTTINAEENNNNQAEDELTNPFWFEDPDHPDKVYKVVKALYGLRQAPRAWQDKYLAGILRKFGLTEGKSASTPIDTEKPLLKDPDGKDVDVHTYRLMIESLMYLTSSRPDIMFTIWKTQRIKHGPTKVKGWKLLESCGVQIITFTSTKLILLVERKYPLIRFTLDQMLNAVRLEVEEESEVSLELLRFTRQQHQEGQHE
nr:retrovirus-related Pol polyprotein from transposon TNT 1-94 [Tanacetum cinerariifolium]